MDSIEKNQETSESTKVANVASSILEAFFGELSTMDDYNEVAGNLRKLVIDDGVFAEPSVRSAIFPDES